MLNIKPPMLIQFLQKLDASKYSVSPFSGKMVLEKLLFKDNAIKSLIILNYHPLKSRDSVWQTWSHSYRAKDALSQTLKRMAQWHWIFKEMKYTCNKSKTTKTKDNGIFRKAYSSPWLRWAIKNFFFTVSTYMYFEFPMQYGFYPILNCLNGQARDT